MDATHLHLLINHVPILGSIFAFCLLAYGLVCRDRSLENAGLVTLIVVSLLTIPAFLSGEESEDAVEKLQGVSEYYLEQHEEVAEIGLWLMVAAGILALVTLLASRFLSRRMFAFKLLTLIFATATLGTMIIVGSHGGKIRHSEIRDVSSKPSTKQLIEDVD